MFLIKLQSISNKLQKFSAGVTVRCRNRFSKTDFLVLNTAATVPHPNQQPSKNIVIFSHMNDLDIASQNVTFWLSCCTVCCVYMPSITKFYIFLPPRKKLCTRKICAEISFQTLVQTNLMQIIWLLQSKHYALCPISILACFTAKMKKHKLISFNLVNDLSSLIKPYVVPTHFRLNIRPPPLLIKIEFFIRSLNEWGM